MTDKNDKNTDGYRWRKYGRKKVKNSIYPRNYYRCNVQDCPAKKFMEKIIENGKERYKTVYKGQHCHEPPALIETPKIENQESFKNVVYNKMINSTNEPPKPTPNSTKRKNGPTFVVELTDQVNSRCDGYHWRKYGEKPLKSSSIARSYYKCVDCNVKKQVEVSSGRILVTYEGVHTHSPSDTIILDNPTIPKKRKMQLSDLLNQEITPNNTNSVAVSLLDLSEAPTQIINHNNINTNNTQISNNSYNNYPPPRTMEPQFMPSTIIYPYYSAPPIVSIDQDDDYFTNSTIQNLLFLKNISNIENNN